jgi:hypothetical protein
MLNALRRGLAKLATYFQILLGVSLTLHSSADDFRAPLTVAHAPVEELPAETDPAGRGSGGRDTKIPSHRAEKR